MLQIDLMQNEKKGMNLDITYFWIMLHNLYLEHVFYRSKKLFNKKKYLLLFEALSPSVNSLLNIQILNFI